MKYTIEGFSQEFALTLRKEVEARGKMITKKIDCTDLVILRWFVDFFPNMKKVEVDGKQYAWLTHKKLMEDLPLIDINKRAFMERMQKLVEFNILTYKLLQEGGTFSLYGFGENYAGLISTGGGVRSNNTGGAVQTTQGARSNDTGGHVQTADKDSSIKDPSIKDISISDKREKKESKKDSFDQLIDKYIEEIVPPDKAEVIKGLLKDWLKVRKAKRAAMTDRAIELNLRALKSVAIESGMSVEKYLEAIIMRGWQAFYPIKEYGGGSGNPNGAASNNPFLNIAKEEGLF